MKTLSRTTLIIKACLYYGKNCTKLAGFENANYFFLIFKTHQLSTFSALPSPLTITDTVESDPSQGQVYSAIKTVALSIF
jgi:hypothetical protein